MSAAPRLRRPGAVTAAAIALIVAGALWMIPFVVSLVSGAAQLTRVPVPIVVTSLVLSLLFPAALLLCAWLAIRGRRGATGLATALGVLAGSFIVTGVDVLGGLTFATVVVAAILLWLPESRADARAARGSRSDAQAEARMLRSRRPLR